MTDRLRVALDETATAHGPGLFGLVTDAAGRTIVLCQNGSDLHDFLGSQAPFVQAALAAA